LLSGGLKRSIVTASD